MKDLDVVFWEHKIIDQYLMYKSILNPKYNLSCFLAGDLYNLDISTKDRVQTFVLNLSYFGVKDKTIYNLPYTFFKYRFDLTSFKYEKSMERHVSKFILDEKFTMPVYIKRDNIYMNSEGQFYRTQVFKQMQNCLKETQNKYDNCSIHFSFPLRCEINYVRVINYYLEIVKKDNRGSNLKISLLFLRNKKIIKYKKILENLIKRIKIYQVYLNHKVLVKKVWKYYKFFKRIKQYILNMLFYLNYLIYKIGFFSLRQKKLNNQIYIFDYLTFFSKRGGYDKLITTLNDDFCGLTLIENCIYESFQLFKNKVAKDKVNVFALYNYIDLNRNKKKFLIRKQKFYFLKYYNILKNKIKYKGRKDIKIYIKLFYLLFLYSLLKKYNLKFNFKFSLKLKLNRIVKASLITSIKRGYATLRSIKTGVRKRKQLYLKKYMIFNKIKKMKVDLFFEKYFRKNSIQKNWELKESIVKKGYDFYFRLLYSKKIFWFFNRIKNVAWNLDSKFLRNFLSEDNLKWSEFEFSLIKRKKDLLFLFILALVLDKFIINKQLLTKKFKKGIKVMFGSKKNILKNLYFLIPKKLTQFFLYNYFKCFNFWKEKIIYNYVTFGFGFSQCLVFFNYNLLSRKNWKVVEEMDEAWNIDYSGKAAFYFFLINHFYYFDNLADYIINSSRTLFSYYPFLDFKLKNKVLTYSNLTLYKVKGCNLGMKYYPALLETEGKGKGYFLENYMKINKSSFLELEFFRLFFYFSSFLYWFRKNYYFISNIYLRKMLFVFLILLIKKFHTALLLITGESSEPKEEIFMNLFSEEVVFDFLKKDNNKFFNNWICLESVYLGRLSTLNLSSRADFKMFKGINFMQKFDYRVIDLARMKYLNENYALSFENYGKNQKYFFKLNKVFNLISFSKYLMKVKTNKNEFKEEHTFYVKMNSLSFGFDFGLKDYFYKGISSKFRYFYQFYKKW